LKRAFLIANPVAGRGRAKHALGWLEPELCACGFELTTLLTEYPGHATELVRRLPPDAVVLSLGGDGTLNEVARACLCSERTVGVLPAGSGDDFAYALGIARHSLQEAIQVIAAGHVRQADAGKVNGTPFLNSLGIGFDAEVAHAVANSPSVFRGQAAYLYGVVQTLSRLENAEVEVTVDGRPFFRGPALLVTTQNGPSTGGGFLFAPEASVFDGTFDVLVAGNFGRMGALGILPKVMKGRHLGHPKIRLTRGKRVHLRWAKPRPGHMEGQLLAAAQEFDIELLPEALRVFAPPE
jgi:YegS/Rv2252/BmrU family lipid kinase